VRMSTVPSHPLQIVFPAFTFWRVAFCPIVIAPPAVEVGWTGMRRNTKGVSITVLLTPCLTGLESAVGKLTIFVFIQTSQTGGQRYSDTSPL